jgi:hypothetical protein
MSRCFPDLLGVIGTVSGRDVVFHGEAVAIAFTGTSDFAATSITGSYRIDQGPCTGETGSFVMSR